jgi:hypothetical protein
MSISRKGKRPIKVDGRQFVWWVSDDEEFHAPTLHLASDCGAVFIKAPIQPTGPSYIVTLGAEFRGARMMQGTHRRFLRVAAVADGAVTPGYVAALIRWATEAGPATEVDWRGNPHG